MKVLKKILLLILAISAAGLLTLGYFGFVPGISAAFGSDKPKNLGISVTSQDLKTARDQIGVAFTTLPPTDQPENSLKFSGRRVVQTSLTDQQLTALMLYDHWKYNFIKNPQIKINPDGTVECAGIFLKNRFPGYVQAHRVDGPTSQSILSNLKYLATDLPVYFKLTAGWADNQLTMDIQKVQLGRFNLSPEMISQFESTVTADIERNVLRVPELTIKSLTFGNGEMKYDGTFPETVAWTEE